MLSSDFIRSTCRADVDGFDHLADCMLNKKLLDELRVSSMCVAQSDHGTIWHREAAKTGVFYFVSLKSPETICLYMPYREIIAAPGLQAIEISCWQSSVMGGFATGWQEARDKVSACFWAAASSWSARST